MRLSDLFRRGRSPRTPASLSNGPERQMLGVSRRPDRRCRSGWLGSVSVSPRNPNRLEIAVYREKKRNPNIDRLETPTIFSNGPERKMLETPIASKPQLLSATAQRSKPPRSAPAARFRPKPSILPGPASPHSGSDAASRS